MLNDDDLAEAYRRGASLAELAGLQECSPGKVRDTLLRNGETLRPPGRKRDQRARGNREAPSAADWAARRIFDEADILVQDMLAELPSGALDALDDETLGDARATAAAVVIARREPAVAAHMAHTAEACTDDSLYSRASRKLNRIAGQAAAGQAAS